MDKETSVPTESIDSEDSTDTNMSHIAVVGYSCCLPGGENVEECWEMIRTGTDCIRDLPSDRIDVTAYFHPDKSAKDKIYCKRGGFIDPVDFDPREFNVNMLQMEDMDANQTLSLLKVKEALTDAGIPSDGKTKKNIGCVLGIGGGQKASHEFYSRLNYVVVEKVLRKIGMPETDVQAAVGKVQVAFSGVEIGFLPWIFRKCYRRSRDKRVQSRRHKLRCGCGVREFDGGHQGRDRRVAAR